MNPFSRNTGSATEQVYMVDSSLPKIGLVMRLKELIHKNELSEIQVETILALFSNYIFNTHAVQRNHTNLHIPYSYV